MVIKTGLNRFKPVWNQNKLVLWVISWRRGCMSHELRRKKLPDGAIAPLSQQNSK